MRAALRRPDLDPGVASGGLDVASRERAEALLRASRMPANEIRWIVTTSQPEVARRHLELHLEALEEWLTEQRLGLAFVQRLLAVAPGDGSRTGGVK